MQSTSTNKLRIVHSFLLATFILLQAVVNNSLFAQNFCENETALFTENFGTGTVPTSHPDIITSALTYQADGELYDEGIYRVVNNTQQKPDWHNSPDHTGNLNGKMLVINGNGNAFYRHTVSSTSGIPAGYYSASLFFMNVNNVNICGAGILLPNISFVLEYQAQDNSWVPLIGSPVIASSVPLSATPTWVQMGGVFTLPATGSFIVQNIRLTLSDGITGGCGNDYAIDDIKLATCPSGGPLPVEFLNISAKQQGTGVAINWSTASEINNKYYDVEKSIDEGANWILVSTTKTSGNNSSVIKKYNAFDSKPVAGLNYYRIKQVDMDSKYKYSVTVSVKVNIDKVFATVLTNPFIDYISIDFLNKASQPVSLILFDMAGKTIATDRWVIPKGSSRKIFDKIKNIQKGMYLLNIVDENGVCIYNGKLVKQ
ncbi:MAG: T9SS type A sorting domain-containing protein [Ferruginibacter sp.]|nr:T9SS type A sorting domain-containing protein [Ferruginibacter sp.]